MATTKIKCPVEGIIDLDRLPGVDAARVEAIIDTTELQRLRRVRQLGFTEAVYPGATHTRFGHSLGTFQGAQRTLAQLDARAGVEIPPEWWVATAMACLLHDVGHGPFSHTFERVTGRQHETRTYEMVLDGPELPHRLEELGAGTVERVESLLRGEVEEPRLRFLADLVSSALDCDRMDYLRRDALHTGAHYGVFDRDWILREMTPTESGDAIVLIEKGRTATEQYLIGRYHMFQNVYLHKTSRGFEGAFRALCQRMLALGPSALPEGSRAFAALHEIPLSLEAFLDLDDMSFHVEFARLVDHDDATVRSLARCLHRRIPLKQKTSMRPKGAGDDLVGLAEKRREDALRDGLDPETAVWEDAAQDVPYRPYAPAEGRKGLRVLRKDGSLVDVTEISPSLAALAKRIVVRRVYWVDPSVAG